MFQKHCHLQQIQVCNQLELQNHFFWAAILFNTMSELIETIIVGIGNGLGTLLHEPLQFLTGKPCSDACGKMWDLDCYIQNFCVANILRLCLGLVCVYIVMFFTYLTYKLRVFHCIFFFIFRGTFTCIGMFIYTFCQCCCCFFREVTDRRRRRAHIGYHERLDSVQLSHYKHRRLRRSRRRHDVRRSLRPMSHRVRVDIRGGSHRGARHRRGVAGGDVGHGVKVTRTTKFANKGSVSSSSRRINSTSSF